jgi:hypothetical protein
VVHVSIERKSDFWNSLDMGHNGKDRGKLALRGGILFGAAKFTKIAKYSTSGRLFPGSLNLVVRKCSQMLMKSSVFVEILILNILIKTFLQKVVVLTEKHIKYSKQWKR